MALSIRQSRLFGKQISGSGLAIQHTLPGLVGVLHQNAQLSVT
jgi:hypothetical protein